MKIEKGYYVKTYNLCDGEIKIGIIENMLLNDKTIDMWRGTNELQYKNEKIIKIEAKTIIYDKRNNRYVFKYPYDDHYGNACFSTIVIQICEFLEPLLISNEKVIYEFDW